MSDPKITFTPTDEKTTVKVGDIYLRYHPKSSLTAIGEWDNGDMEYLAIDDLVVLRDFLTNCIISHKVSLMKLKNNKSPF